MKRDVWLFVFALLGPFFGVAWFTALARWASLLGTGAASPRLVLAAQVVGGLIGLAVTVFTVLAARREEDE